MLGSGSAVEAAPDLPAELPGGGEVRSVGAIAAAIGVRPERGMPDEFEMSLGDLLHRMPAASVRSGRHDANRVLRIPAAEVVPGLVKGRVEISVARLVSLAPDVFRWERNEADDPKVRLPIQRLLQQIGSHESAPGTRKEPSVIERTGVVLEVATGSENVTAHLPAIDLGKSAIPATRAPEQSAAAIHPPVLGATVESGAQVVKLRPREDASISTTLRAVVLGGTPVAASNAAAQAGQILAPRAAAAPPPAPSVERAPGDAAPSVVGASAEALPVADFAGLQSLFMTGMPLDLAGVAALTAALPGVHACLIRGVLGSAESGRMPPGLNVGEVRGASEEFARKIGDVESTTIHRGDSAIAIFLRGGVCLSAVIDSGGFVPGVRERLLRVAELLAGPSAAA